MEDFSHIELELDKSYLIYHENLNKIHPGSKEVKDNYCKAISMMEQNNPFTKNPEEQKEHIKKILNLFNKKDQDPKLLYLYCDFLQYNHLKDMENRNTPKEIKDLLLNHFIQKFFKLNTKKEKIISRTNYFINSLNVVNLKNPQTQDNLPTSADLLNLETEKIYNLKNIKLKRINHEIENTLKRILRMLDEEDIRNKDFEYYLKHFKLKKLDTIFLKQEQTDLHYNLRKDDFEVYLREICYKDKLFYQMRAFEPNLKFFSLKKGYETWKNSKIFLQNLKNDLYKDQINKIDLIFQNEVTQCNPAEIKVFREYYMNKYKYYYLLKERFETERIKTKIMKSYINDIIYPPYIITLNAEIKYCLKDLCEHYNLEFNTAIDKGKAYYYYLDGKIPEIFGKQKKYFQYNLYELKLIEDNTVHSNSQNNISHNHEVENVLNLENKVTDILRDKYHLSEGFNVHSQYKLNELSLKNFSFNSEIYKKKANWLNYICIFPKIDQKYLATKRKIESIGYIDSMLIYELHLVGEVDLNTLNRLVEDYTLNFKSRNKKNAKILSTSTEENDYSSLRHLVKEVIDNAATDEEKLRKMQKNDNQNGIEEDFIDKINLDLLRYYLILRFLKIRDLKFWIINILNFFRYLQKKFSIDLYKIENKNWKKSEDYESLIGTLNEYLNLNHSNENNKNIENNNPIDGNIINNPNEINNIHETIDKNNLKIQDKILSNKENNTNFTKTNPIIPTLDINIENSDPHQKKENENFHQVLFDEIEETVEYSEKIIRIKDTKGNYIIYDATISDMEQLENELGKIGTFYINKREELIVDSEKNCNPVIDRSQVILDLFMSEFDFLYAKFELIKQLLFCYDNITDVIQQKSLIQIITDIIAQRPLLDVNYYYFTENYILETEILRKKNIFFKKLIFHQIKTEKEENKLIHEKNQKLYWLLGECALDLIKHVRLDKLDIHIIKDFIKEKREKIINFKLKEAQVVEIESFIDIVDKLISEKDFINENINNPINNIDLQDEENEENKKNKNQENFLLDNEGNLIENLKEEKEINLEENILKFKKHKSLFDEDENLIKEKLISENFLNKTKDFFEKENNIHEINIFNALDAIELESTFEKQDFPIEELTKKNSTTENLKKSNIYLPKVENNNTFNKEKNLNEKKNINPKIEKIFGELIIIIKFLKKVFSKTLSANVENYKDQENNFEIMYNYEYLEDEKKLKELELIENYEPIKKFLTDNVLGISNNLQNRRLQALYSKYSINNYSNNIETINYKIRSLLNIPYHFKDENDKNLIENNNIITDVMKEEINFAKFEEGFPQKILSEYSSEEFLKNENLFLKNYDFFESLDVIIPIFIFMNDGISELKTNFKCENFISSKALELCAIQNFINTWEKFKDYITGKSKNIEYENMIYLNNTLMNDPQNMIYLVRSLTATLSNTVNRIPPQILAKLPIQFLEKLNINLEDLKNPEDNIKNFNFEKIQNTKLDDLNLTLINILKKDIKSGWLDFDNSKNVCEIKFYCNLLELYRMKQLIERLINYSIYLSSVYNKQKDILLGTKDNLLSFKKPLNLEHPSNLENKKNFIDNFDYYKNKIPQSSAYGNPNFIISEFESTFHNCLNFHDVLTCQMNLLDAGLYEVKTFAQYQYMHYYLLLVGVQYNQNFLHEAYLHSCELDLIENNKLIIFNSTIDLNYLLEQNQENKFNTRILKMRSKVNLYINKLGREFFFSILDRKFQQREFIEKKYHEFLENQINISPKTYIVKRILSRHYRLVYTNAYAKEKMTETYLEAIKLQACKGSKILKEMISMIPKEYNLFEVNNLNFLDNENKIFTHVNKNFQYFNDRNNPFNAFYIPSDIEILRLETQTSQDRIFHYSQFQPLYRIEEINNPQFFSQINDFFKSPKLKNSIEPYRNKFFSEAISYNSNALCLLQMTQFFINILNFKFMEMSLNQKSEDMIKLLECNERGIDFWGDKKIFTPNNANVEENKLPLHIIENIINDEKNYMNLRLNFDKFKIELETVIDNLKSYVKTNANPKKPIIYMHSYTEILTNFWLFIFYRVRENTIKSNDLNSSIYITRILNSIINTDYFKQSLCNFPCHINENFLVDFQNNKYNFYNPGMSHIGSYNKTETKYFDMKYLFYKNLSLIKSSDSETEIEYIKNNYYRPVGNYTHMDNETLSIYSTIKYDILFLSEKRFGELRNMSFKVNSLSEKYMIFLEINRNNTDSIEINKLKSNFYEIYVKLCEFKYKYFIMIYNKILNFNGERLEKIEMELRNTYSFIIPNDNLEDLNEKVIADLITSNNPKANEKKELLDNSKNIPTIVINKGKRINSPRIQEDNINSNEENKKERKSILKFNSPKMLRKTSLIFLKLMEDKKDNIVLEDVLINNNLVENNIKLEHHQIMEYLIKGSKLLFDFYKNEIKTFYLRQGINTLNRENSALIELFNISKNDLDINKFKNKFSCSLLKDLDDLHYSTINRKFSFFEIFLNKIQNISLEVETHTVSNAIILTKYEFENAIKNLIRDFIIYDVNIRNNLFSTNSSENFGLFSKIKKQEICITILKEKLKEYDMNFEKICNAKLALQGNRLVYEMDNLYRQIKILKNNIVVMEEYIKSYFEEKFQGIIKKLKTESDIIENKFFDFKENIISSTIQNITEEYNQCLGQLQSKALFLTETAKVVDSNGVVVNDTEKSFFENFNREMEIETNYNREINKERKKNDFLFDDISKLHAFYRMKIFMQKNEYEKNLADLNSKLSSNQDLWDKLGIAEKNEHILKEELTKTQKNLAYAQEFNKKLQGQIRKSHDTNTNLEKQISMISANQIINNASKGENIKALELHAETKHVYLYNMKNNPNLVHALENIKLNHPDDLDIKIIIENLESLHLKYTQELDSKRNFVNMLNKIKDDVTNMREINRINLDEANNQIKNLKEMLHKSKIEIEILKANCKNSNHQHVLMEMNGNDINKPNNLIPIKSYGSNKNINSNLFYSNNFNKNNIQADNNLLLNNLHTNSGNNFDETKNILGNLNIVNPSISNNVISGRKGNNQNLLKSTGNSNEKINKNFGNKEKNILDIQNVNKDISPNFNNISSTKYPIINSYEIIKEKNHKNKNLTSNSNVSIQKNQTSEDIKKIFTKNGNMESYENFNVNKTDNNNVLSSSSVNTSNNSLIKDVYKNPILVEKEKKLIIAGKNVISEN